MEFKLIDSDKVLGRVEVKPNDIEAELMVLDEHKAKAYASTKQGVEKADWPSVCTTYNNGHPRSADGHPPPRLRTRVSLRSWWPCETLSRSGASKPMVRPTS